MNNERIQEIKGRHEAATQGPWEMVDLGSINIATGHHKAGDKHVANWICEMDVQDENEEEQAYADADFIANAPDDIAYLLSEVERLQEELKFYADEDNYLVTITETDWGPIVPIDQDRGKRARDALSHLKGE